MGSKDLASYLVVTPQGNILINSSLEESPALIRKSIEKLGFKYADTRILLISHAHWDHDAGSARIIKETGAKYMVMDGDVPVVESGGKTDFAYGDSPYPKAKVDRVLHDGDEVKLGDAVLVAHKTAGHTRGCTTWTMKVKQNGKTLDAVIVGSWNVNPGFRLVDKPGQAASYPGIADLPRRARRVLRYGRQACKIRAQRRVRVDRPGRIQGRGGGTRAGVRGGAAEAAGLTARTGPGCHHNWTTGHTCDQSPPPYERRGLAGCRTCAAYRI